MPPDATPAAALLRSAVGRVGLASATDGELVRRYADHRDDLAFAELVHRFAPAVYALCRRHLSDPASADDAFQTVFVLLARKAGTLLHPDRVGGWLTGTADRVARTARRRHFRRTAKLRPLDSVPEPSSEPLPPSDLRAVLDDELAKLPAHYRAVVTLCDLDGVSRRDAAVRLNIPTGTLSNRLTRARAVLGRRLLRRGVLVAAGAVVSSGSMATPPARLLASAVRVALADSPPPELLPLFPPEVLPMPRGKLWLFVVAGLVLAGGVTTGVLLLTQKPSAPPTSGATPPTSPPPTEGEQTKASKPVTPTTAVNPNAPKAGVEPKPALVKDTFTFTALSPNGKWFVGLPTSFGGNIRVMETATWREAAVIDWKELKGVPHSVAVTDDGKRVFVATGSPKSLLRVWDVDAKRYEERAFDLGAEGVYPNHMRLSPDGKTLAAYMFGGDGTKRIDRVRCWEAATGTVTRTIDVPPFASGSLALIDDGKTVAGVCAGNSGVTTVSAVREWDVATGAEKRVIELGNVADTKRGQVLGNKVIYTADGKQVVVGGGYWLPTKPGAEPDSPRDGSGSVWVIDRESGKLVKTLIDRRRDIVRGLHLTPDGKKVIVQPTLSSRLDRDIAEFSHQGSPDAEFVELQQWDVATWELDWVKIVPKAERWKLWNGSAK